MFLCNFDGFRAPRSLILVWFKSKEVRSKGVIMLIAILMKELKHASKVLWPIKYKISSFLDIIKTY
jgi:hypothetical protein